MSVLEIFIPWADVAALGVGRAYWPSLSVLSLVPVAEKSRPSSGENNVENWSSSFQALTVKLKRPISKGWLKLYQYNHRIFRYIRYFINCMVELLRVHINLFVEFVASKLLYSSTTIIELCSCKHTKNMPTAKMIWIICFLIKIHIIKHVML